MTEPTALQVVVLVLAAAGGALVVRERNPLHQSFVAGGFGVVLAVLFLVFHAPDVAISEIVVSTFVIPTLVLVALTKTGGNR
jgi:energy-converting hydrogenase B subunit D